MRRIPFKSGLLIFVSTLWLLSIGVPPVLQMLDEQGPTMSIALSEEESKEQEYTDDGEEVQLWAYPQHQGVSFSPSLEKRRLHTVQSFRSFSLDIQLPPPETLS